MTVSRSMRTSILWLFLGIVSATSMAFYVFNIWRVNQPEQFSDLYAPWWGAHELLLHGRNPYSPAVAHEIQQVIYNGSRWSPTDSTDIAGGFAYPPYAALLLLPIVHMSFPAAQRIFLCASVLLTLFSFALWLRGLRFRLSPITWLTVGFFFFGSFPALQALKLENLSLVAAAFLAISMFLISSDHLILAGIFLAVSTFKPQFTLAVVAWMAVWTFSDWRRRGSLAWAFLGFLAVLLIVSEVLVPGWIRLFLNVIQAYRHYTFGQSILDVWLTPTFGPLASAGLLLASLSLCWRYRKEPAGSPRFFLIVSMLLAANVVVIPTLAPHAQLLLLPGFLWLLRSRPDFWSGAPPGRLLFVGAFVFLAWPWISTACLLIASLRYPTPWLLRFWEVPLYTSPLLPLALFLVLVWGVRMLPNPAKARQGSASGSPEGPPTPVVN